MINKKGFTLVELLGVIIVIGVVAVIAVPAVKDINTSSKEKVLEKQIDTIVKSAEDWSIINSDLLEEEAIFVKVETLKNNGLLENKDIINPVTKTKINGCVKITYQESYNQYVYEYVDTCDLNNSF